MEDDITNKMLLEHMQVMKNDLQTQITDVKTSVRGLGEEVHRGFTEAKEHRQALQADLEATMQLQLKHQEKLARISV